MFYRCYVEVCLFDKCFIFRRVYMVFKAFGCLHFAVFWGVICSYTKSGSL